MTEIRVNASRAIYPPDVLRKMIEQAQPSIDARRMIGQLDSPSDGKSRLSQASHIVTNLRIDERGCVKADVEFIDTPTGKVSKEMLKMGAPMHGALRGVGTRGPDGKLVVEGRLTAVDLLPGFPEEDPDVVTQLGDVVRELPDS